MKEEIKELEDKINHLKNGIQMLKNHGKELEKMGARVAAHITAISVSKLDDVAKVKNIIRNDFSHFEFNHSFYSQGQVISTWTSEETDWRIWLETKMEDFPAELKKDSCKWVKTSVTEDDYHLVCEQEE